MAKKVIVISLILIVVVGVSYAQQSGNFPQRTNEPTKSSFSLLDPSRLHMSQSYSFMYSSSKYGSQNLGMYLNSIEYQISDPLQIRFDIAYLHSPGSLVSGNGTLQDGQILPGLSLRWRPSRNFLFQFDYHEAPSLFYNDRNGFYPSYIYPSGEGH